MLAGLLMISKGDRIAMNASVETRYPFLDDDVIAFCAGIAPEYKLRGLTEKWILRQVAARILPEQIANRPKTMFRASLAQTFLGPQRPAWVDQLLSPESLRATGYFDAASVLKQRSLADRSPTPHPGPLHLRRRAHLRGLDPALAPHLLRRRTLRSADVGASCRRDHGGRRRDDKWSIRAVEAELHGPVAGTELISITSLFPFSGGSPSSSTG